MRKGYSKLLINEIALPDKGANWLMTGLDWELMTFLSGRERTEAEWRKMMESAGLKLVKIFRHPQSIDSVIEVELP